MNPDTTFSIGDVQFVLVQWTTWAIPVYTMQYRHISRQLCTDLSEEKPSSTLCLCLPSLYKSSTNTHLYTYRIVLGGVTALSSQRGVLSPTLSASMCPTSTENISLHGGGQTVPT